jgi:glyoxylase-like metal-dependent hydrolase (beta-lactamase superfamily II)
MKIIPLSEGSFTVDKSKKFIPFDTTSDSLQQRSLGSLLVEVQPFVVITSRDVLLLDTGLGFEQNGMPQLHRNLINAGIRPSEVTKILISHLHKDHAGGISRKTGAGEVYEISFPQATHYIQEKELDYALQKGFPSYITEEFAMIKQTGPVVLLDGDGVIDEYIRYELTGAHCPYHQVFWIEENTEKIFFGGDVAPQYQQMKSRFIAKYDYDGKKSMELRRKWWLQGEQEKWSFLFYHDIKMPIWKF